MALDHTAALTLATAQVDAAFAGITSPPGSEAQITAAKQQAIDAAKQFYEDLFAGITANAVVSPAGSPSPLSVADLVSWAAAVTTRVNALAVAAGQPTISGLASADVAGTGKVT